MALKPYIPSIEGLFPNSTSGTWSTGILDSMLTVKDFRDRFQGKDQIPPLPVYLSMRQPHLVSVLYVARTGVEVSACTGNPFKLTLDLNTRLSGIDKDVFIVDVQCLN